MPKKVLGKGLEALIPQGAGPAGGMSGERVVEIPLGDIVANPHQPRKTFNNETLHNLSASIKEDGVLQPVVVRRKGEKFELIMGERRVQAAELAEMPTVPAIVRTVEEVDSLRLALVENIQRDNLNVIEVARAYRSLVATFGLSQAELANMVGKDRSSVANTMRLLNLPEAVQAMIKLERERLLGGGRIFLE